MIELLIVITIIGILASMIFAGGNFAIKKARIVEAQQTAVAIAQGVEQFETEYNRMPIPGGGKGKDWEGDTSEEFCLIMTGQETSGKVINKKKIDYFDGLKNATGSPPIGGIDRSIDGQPVVVDPWGNFYIVHIDGAYDKKLNNPEGEDENGNSELKGVRVAVLSKGADGVAEGNNDDGGDATGDNARSW